MPKRIYQVGEPCDQCGTPAIQGQFGAYCYPCFKARKERQNQMQPPVNGYHPASPYNAPQPPQRPPYQQTGQIYTPPPQPAPQPDFVPKSVYMQNLAVLTEAIKKLQARVHALEAVSLYQKESKAVDFHKATAPDEDIPIINPEEKTEPIL